MDVPRLRARPFRRAAIAVVLFTIACGGVVAAWSSARIHPSNEPAVERTDVVIATVRRTDLVRSVAAPGTLDTDRVYVVAAPSDGVVRSLPVRPGARVVAGMPIATMDNPDLEAAAADAAAQLRASREELRDAVAQAETARLTQLGAAQDAHAIRQQAAVEVRVDSALYRDGLIAELPFRLARLKLEQAAEQERIARARVAADAADARAKAAIASAKVIELEDALRAKRAQLDALVLRAGSTGVVQSVAADLGQRVPAGAAVARIADERDLKAVIQIPEAQAHDVTAGDVVKVATPSGALRGRIARIEPAAQNGAVAADVRLVPPLPAGLRPDMQVDATVELARLRDVLVVSRPAGTADDQAAELFRVSADGRRATRVAVRFGVGSVDQISIRSGVGAGDRVIVSDSSAWAGNPSIRLQ